MNKTISQVVEEYRNRQTPQFERIGVLHPTGMFERYSDPSNIKEHFENNGWLEFDTVCDCTATCPNSTITTSHVKLYMGTIVEYREIISDVKKHA